jgi:hypothetical protein
VWFGVDQQLGGKRTTYTVNREQYCLAVIDNRWPRTLKRPDDTSSSRNKCSLSIDFQ